jgi:hypothetical protein
VTITKPTAFERRTVAASLIFDLVDGFARRRATAGDNPPVRGPVRFRIVATVAGGASTDVDPPLDMAMERSASGYYLWFGELVDSTGRRFACPLPPPSLVIEITSPQYQRVTLAIHNLPQGGAPQPQIEMQPGYAYEFPHATTVANGTGPTLLGGKLRNPDGTGITDQVVEVSPPPPNQPPPNPAYVTDETGIWLLAFDDAVVSTTTAQLHVGPAGQPPTVVQNATISRGEATALQQAGLVGTTTRGPGAPLVGVLITVDAAPGITVTSDSDGRYELWLLIDQFPPGPPTPVVVTATPPQGPAAHRNVQLTPRSTTQVDPFVFP